MDTRTALIQSLIPLFYEVKPRLPRSKAISSYRIKHDLEHGIFAEGKFYFSNSETIPALVAMGIPHYPGDPNYGFKLQDKFRTMWVRNRPPTTRPKYESKKKWEAYLHARAEMDAILTELGATNYSSLAEVVGHEGEGKLEVPPLLAARAERARADVMGSPGTQSPSPTRSSPQDD